MHALQKGVSVTGLAQQRSETAFILMRNPATHDDRWVHCVHLPVQSELEYLPEILLSISRARTREMQLALRTVWHRFMWSSLPIFSEIVSQTCRESEGDVFTVGERVDACAKEPEQDDAFDTVMQQLLARTLM